MRWLLVAILLGVGGCVGQNDLDLARWDCEGHEDAVDKVYTDCWHRESGGSGSSFGTHVDCLRYAVGLWCERRPDGAPPSATIPDLRDDLEGCLSQRDELSSEAEGCVEAKSDQQELRFWKRCGVIQPGNYDQWAECNGGDAAAEMACNPAYGPVDELCVGSNAEHYARMQQDGVSWIDCKEGEVCQ